MAGRPGAGRAVAGVTLEELGAEVHEMAVRKGWWQSPFFQRIRRLGEWLREEAFEAEEALAVQGKRAWHSVDAEGLEKPEGVGSELADIWLLAQDITHGVEDYARSLGIDLTVTTREKLSYDQVRKYKRDKTGTPL